MRRVLLSALVIISLCACTQAAEPKPEASAPVAETEVTPSKEADEQKFDDLEACKIFIADGEPGAPMIDIPGLLISMPPELNIETVAPYMSTNNALTRAMLVSSPELRQSIERIRAPFKEITDLVAKGGGDLNADTSSFQTDIGNVLSLCGDAGYKIGS